MTRGVDSMEAKNGPYRTAPEATPLERELTSIERRARVESTVAGSAFALVLLVFLFALGTAGAQSDPVGARARESAYGAPAALPPRVRDEQTSAAGSDLDRIQSRLALAVAKVAANEASLATIRPADVALIHQVATARASTPREQLRWLRAHSPCVLGGRDVDALARPGNCRWTRALRDSGAEPEGWRETYPHLAWGRYARRWSQVRAVARRLVAGELVMRPCPSPPWTWGSVRLDMERALARGLVPLGCRDPLTGERLSNDGFARAAAGDGPASAALSGPAKVGAACAGGGAREPAPPRERAGRGRGDLDAESEGHGRPSLSSREAIDAR